MAITFHRVRDNKSLSYIQTGSYKVLLNDLAKMFIESMTEEELRAFLAKYEKDEFGWTTGEKKGAQ